MNTQFGILEIYKTDETLAQHELMFRSLDRDIAESKMMKLFKERNSQQDFVLYSQALKKIISTCFTNSTIKALNLKAGGNNA